MIGGASAIAVATIAESAAFAEPRRLPAPFVLPELSHPRLDARVDWLLGRMSPDQAGRPAAVAGVFRPAVETSLLVPRRLFFGLAWPVAAALPPDGGLAPGEAGVPSGARALLGNVGGHVRAVFPLPESLEIGFTLGVVAPTALFDRSSRADRSVAEAAASLDPTSFVHFRPGRFALRPAGDVRFVRGPFVFQLRHGIDVVVDVAGVERVKLAGRLLGHVGLLVRPDLEVSMEATQLYLFSSDEELSGASTPGKAFAEEYRISDEHRSALTVGPGVRLSLRDVDLGAAVVTNLSSPLSPAARGFLALNLSVIAHLGEPAR